MREFEVLQKVSHENIVKLLAIEDDQEGRGKVNIESASILSIESVHQSHR